MKLARYFVISISLLVGLILVLVLGIGWFIAPQDALKKSDAIIVVSGGDTNKRTDEGVRLWRAGWAPLLVMSGAAADQGTSNAAVMKLRAVSEGVPANAILTEEKSTNTNENAQFLKPILDARQVKSAILVSSPYHTRRVKETFHKYYGNGYTFIAHPAKDTAWARSSWWQKPSTIQLTFEELQKTIYVMFLQH